MNSWKTLNFMRESEFRYFVVSVDLVFYQNSYTAFHHFSTSVDESCWRLCLVASSHFTSRQRLERIVGLNWTAVTSSPKRYISSPSIPLAWKMGGRGRGRGMLHFLSFVLFCWALACMELYIYVIFEAQYVITRND